MSMREEETFVLPAHAFHSLFDLSFYIEILGNLNNHDNDNNDNVQKQLVLQAKQQLCKCIMLFSTFLWRPLHDYDMKPLNATFYGGHEYTTTNFF